MAKTSKKKPVKKSELEISRKNEIIMGLQVCEARERLDAIAQIIENVDNRCMAADGPVTPTLKEMTQEEIKEIYELAKQHREAGKPLQVFITKEKWDTVYEYRVDFKRGVQLFHTSYQGSKSECEWYAHQLRVALCGGPRPRDEKTLNDLQDAVMLLRRLLYRVKQDCPEPYVERPAVVAQAEDWLRRKGLQGSVLREGGQE